MVDVWKMLGKYSPAWLAGKLSFRNMKYNSLTAKTGILDLYATLQVRTEKHSLVQRLIKNEDAWLDMLEKRTLGVHTYNEDQAKEIYKSIKDEFAKALKCLVDEQS